jgi:hypothetical protein
MLIQYIEQMALDKIVVDKMTSWQNNKLINYKVDKKAL